MNKSPAADAGIQDGDIITEFDGKKITDSRHLRLMASQTPPKTKVKVKLLRDGKEKNVNLVLGELPAEQMAARTRERERPGNPSRGSELIDGVTVTDLDNRSRRQFNIPDEIRGALVTEVAPDSPAATGEQQLRPGDVILEVNRKKVTNSQQVLDAVKKNKSDRALLQVWS